MNLLKYFRCSITNCCTAVWGYIIDFLFNFFKVSLGYFWFENFNVTYLCFVILLTVHLNIFILILTNLMHEIL